jgi:hypothetical protein
MKSLRLVFQVLGFILALFALIGCQQSTSPAPAATSPLVTATITGRILDENTSKPVSGATVYVGTTSATTNSNGIYTISGVASGTYMLRAMYKDSTNVSYSSTNNQAFSVMDLATFKEAATASSTSASESSNISSSVISVTNNFNATTYTYTDTLTDILIAQNSATIGGIALEQVNGATQGNAIPVPKGSTIILQFNPYTGSPNTASFGQSISTTISDNLGSFSISGLPAWDYFFSGTSQSARFLLQTTTSGANPTNDSIGNGLNSNWVVGTINVVKVYPNPLTTLSLTATPIYFNIQTMPALALVTSNIQNSQSNENDSFAAANPVTLTFNNTLVSYKAASTYLQRALDGSFVDATPSISGTVLTITPTAALNANTRYIVTYSVSDGSTTASSPALLGSAPNLTGGLQFETAGSGATAPTDLALDTAAKANKNSGVSGYNAGDSLIYIQYTQNPAFKYYAQYKLATESSWQTDISSTITPTGVNGSIAHSSVSISYPNWVSGTTLDLRLLVTNNAKAIGDLVGSPAFSAPILINDTIAPKGGTITGAASVTFGPLVTLSPNVISYPTATSNGMLGFTLALNQVDSADEVMSLPTIGGLSATIFGTPQVELTNSGAKAAVLLPVLAGQFFGQAQFTLTASDGAGNPYPATATASAMTITLQALPAPTVVAAVAGAPGSISITITPTLGGTATGYNIYWGTTALSQPNLIQVANTSAYVQTGLTATTTYYYLVKATNAGGESPAYVNVVSATAQ